MKKVLFTLLLVDLSLAFIVYMWKGQVWLINSQVAFFSTSLIMLASMQSYKNMVLNALDTGAVADDGRDTLDKLEDPYELYDEVEDGQVNDKEKTLVEVVKEERDNLKKGRRSIWETAKDAKASFSFYRLGGYGVLVLGFFYLNSNKVLELIPYLIFLSIPPFIIVLTLMQNKEK
jgi:hypothetical protein